MPLSTSPWKDLPVAVVGDLMLDIYTYGTISRVNPERPAAPLLHVTRTDSHLGGAGNVAHNIHALGGSVSLYGVLNEDPSGALFRHMCAEHAIHLYDYTDKRPTTTKTRIVEEIHNDQVCRIDHEVQQPIDPSLAAYISKRIISRLDQYRALVLSDYGKGVLTRELTDPLLTACREKNLPVLVDPKPQNISHFSGCTLLTPNLSEAETILGATTQTDLTGEQRLEYLCGALQRVTQSSMVVITCGSEGMVGIDSHGRYTHARSQAKHIFDVTGAGDTVLAVLALYLGANHPNSLDFHEALRLANLGGNIAVGKVGTSTISLEELLEAASKS